jgi:hypothetical protein
VFTNAKARGMKSIAAVIVTTASLTAAMHASAKPFSFGHVEYMPRDQRVPAAQAFVAKKLPPGTPIASALEILRRADGSCRTPNAAGKPITCTHASFEHRPLSAELTDVIWIVKIIPSADGTVASATVQRSTND